MTMHTDNETDRVLSLRLSSRIPLPPEVCLSDPEAAQKTFRKKAFYSLMGVGDHPVVRFLQSFETAANMAEVMNQATHLDRMAHYSAWKGDDYVKTVDLCKDTDETG